jgi:hypothetical protein
MKDFKIDVFFLLKLGCNKLFGCNYFDLGYLPSKYEKTIYWDGGGGYYGYYMGIAKAIKEMYPLTKIHDNHWVFCSAGSLSSNALMCDTSVEDIFNNCIEELSIISKKKMYGVHHVNKITRTKYLKYCNFEFIKTKSISPIALHINIMGVASACIAMIYTQSLLPLLACIFCFNISYSYAHNTINDYANACVSSHNLLITGGFTDSIIRHPSKWYIICMDAGPSIWLLAFFFGLECLFPYNQTNVHIIHTEMFRKRTLSDTLNLTSVENVKKLYNLGYTDSYKNKDILDKIFLPFYTLEDLKRRF